MSSGLEITLAEFAASVHDSKNRQVSIPAAIQRELGLTKRRDNHIIRVSIRKQGAPSRRWNHHYFKLTGDNEFSIPSDVAAIKPGDRLDVKVHRVIADVEYCVRGSAPEAHKTFADLAEEWRREEAAGLVSGWRTDGSTRHDEYLTADVHGLAR